MPQGFSVNTLYHTKVKLEKVPYNINKSKYINYGKSVKWQNVNLNPGLLGSKSMLFIVMSYCLSLKRLLFKNLISFIQEFLLYKTILIPLKVLSGKNRLYKSIG